jgi:hypothetical protein
MPRPLRALASLALLALAASLSPLTACSSSSDGGAPATDAGSDTGSTKRCVRGAKATAVPTTCNGSEALCARRFDRVTFPMTHNAMSNADDGWAAPNQNHGIARQLQDGIRGLMLDTHYYDEVNGYTDARVDGVSPLDQAYLCHGTCDLGKRPLLDGLCDVTQLLDAHRGEIVSIIFEDYVTPEDTAAVMQAAGLTEYVHTHVLGTPWPTLRELIDKNERLIVFSETPHDAPAWYHPAWKHIWDTSYTYKSVADFDCATNRGQRSNALFLINHWLQTSAGLPDPTLAAQANASSVMLARAQTCSADAGRPPTFLGVDAYDVGALFDVVKAMNGL